MMKRDAMLDYLETAGNLRTALEGYLGGEG